MPYYIETIALGDTESLSLALTEESIQHFGQASGDWNPVHYDDEVASRTIFGRRIAHGFHTASAISAVIGEKLPGAGTIYLGQTLEFRKPVFPGQTITATVNVVAVDRDRNRVTLDCTCTVNDKPVIVGEAVVMAPTGG